MLSYVSYAIFSEMFLTFRAIYYYCVLPSPTDTSVKCQENDVYDVTGRYSCACHTVSMVIQNLSVLECAAVCLARPSCVMFAVGRADGRLSICAITDGRKSDQDLRATYARLYIIVHRESKCGSG